MRRSDPKKGIPGGSIVNLATAHGVSAYPEAAVYCASKHAVVGITKCASREEAKFGIRVNAIAPSV